MAGAVWYATGYLYSLYTAAEHSILVLQQRGGFSSRETHRTQPALKTNNLARPWARGRPQQRGGEADETPAPADWQPTPNRCKRPWGIGPGLWTTRHRITGESDRRHLSRGPMPAAIEQSWPYTSYPGQPASSISIVHQSKRLHVELPHQGQQPAASKQRARGGGGTRLSGRPARKNVLQSEGEQEEGGATRPTENEENITLCMKQTRMRR